VTCGVSRQNNTAAVSDAEIDRLQQLSRAELAANVVGLRSAVERLQEIAALQAKTINSMRYVEVILVCI